MRTSLTSDSFSSFWTEIGTGEGEGVAPEQWYDRIAQAGRDGWELVSTTETSAGESLYFKRRE